MKKIIIAGGTGFIGDALEKHFTEAGHAVVILTRTPRKPNHIKWDGEQFSGWEQQLEGSDLLINLSGKSVDCRYNEKNKTAILNSRVKSTRILQKAVERCETPPAVWLNSSTATIYAGSKTHRNTESNGIIGDDFSMGVAKAWEAAFFESPTPLTRKVALRISLVIGESGGVYAVLKKLAKIGLGGRAGDGKQKFAYITVNDLLRAVDFIIENDQLDGVVNCTSPEDLTNEQFMQKLRKHLGVRIYLNQPKWMIKLGALLIGTESELILKSRYVYPEKLLNAGFEFKHPIQ